MNREEFLEKEIRKHDHLFWVLNKPEISDEEYHELTRELRELNPNNSVLTEIHTPVVDSSGHVKHLVPMLSLDKVYTIEELIDWANKVKRNEEELFLIQNKFDGWSVEKNHNILSTRGDGFVGDDISNKVAYIKLLDNSPVSEILYVHGELVMLKSDFEIQQTSILRKSGEQYKTPRTILTGLLTKDEIRNGVGRVLTLLPFDSFQMEVPFPLLKTIDWDDLINGRKNADYPIDGLVLKLADQEYGKSLGVTSHHVKSAMALKFTNPTGKTVLRDVILSVGKTKLTPVGIVDPVEIGGVIVNSPNLHNYKYILDKDIHIGDTLILERCGDIIPDVKEVIPGKSRVFISFKKCPTCDSSLTFNDTDLICNNTECTGKHVRRLVDSVIRIGIERLGGPTIAKLVAHGCSDLIDIFNLTKGDILKLERFGDSSSDNLLEEIQKVKNKGVYEWQILASLNIHGIGRRMSKMILENMTLEELRHKTADELETLKGIGNERAYQIHCGLEDHGKYINGLISILSIIGAKSMEEKTICFTGTMPETRSYYEKLARENGWEPVSRVTKSLSTLVCADVNSTSGKTGKAKKYGIQIIHVNDFMKMLEG